ncbi:hypothetical protein VKT23_015247 [Stygiomarasmius scandens]|uniref:DUF6818 domain-containing protein n=1 Tax=Marasmiellus scandens TaxID=2682957 RepID=A0ABR1J198_9AGAR
MSAPHGTGKWYIDENGKEYVQGPDRRWTTREQASSMDHQFNFVRFIQLVHQIGNPTSIQIPAGSSNDLPPHRIPPSRSALAVDSSNSSSTGASTASRSSDSAKAKGKAKANPPDDARKGSAKRKAADPPELAEKHQKGRTAGSANYNAEDLEILFQILRERLPLGPKGWMEVEGLFNEEAQSTGRPGRTAKSLELKFKQLVKTTKPTGDAELPPHAQEALEIEELMNEKAGTRDLDDEEINEVVGGAEDINETEKATPQQNRRRENQENVPFQRTTQEPAAPRAVRRPTERSSRLSGNDFLASISAALSPAAQIACDEQNATRSFNASQLIMLSSQVQDLQRTIDNMRTELADERRRAERAEA